MIRLACGIENTEDLIADLAQALERALTSRALSSIAMQFRTRAIHVGQNAIRPPARSCRRIHLATTFVQPAAGEWGEFDYSRSGNPTRKAFEQTLASLEGGCGALAFASGMAATHCVTMLLAQGDHVVAGTDIYGGTYRLLHKIVNRAGIDVSLVQHDRPGRGRAGHHAARGCCGSKRRAIR